MNITKKTENNVLTIALEGRLDTVTAPELENEIRSSAEGVSRLSWISRSLPTSQARGSECF